jgi:hypothetical protein
MYNANSTITCDFANHDSTTCGKPAVVESRSWVRNRFVAGTHIQVRLHWCEDHQHCASEQGREVMDGFSTELLGKKK